MELSLKACLKRRKEELNNSDMASYDAEVMYNPLEPDELLRTSGSSLLPKSEAAKQRIDLIDYEIYARRAMIGTLSYDTNELYGVSFEKDLTGLKRPIIDWDSDEEKVDKKGAFVMYEQPPDFIPENLYHVIYDPAKFTGDGESLHSIIVYKHFYVGRDKSLEDCIVAEWIGRLDKLDDNYEMVIKIAKFFNARIFPETNVPGFVYWCDTKNFSNMLTPSADYLEKEINPNTKGNRHRVGFDMSNKRKKQWCIKKAANWLLEPKVYDPVTGVTIARNIDRLFSLRMLSEIIAYNLDDNFDHISTLLGLMLLIGKLDGLDLPNVDEENPDDYFNKYEIEPQVYSPERERSRFLQY
jgi:hypothetical protein